MARTLPDSVWQSRRELIARQSQSGKSVLAFCQEQNLSVATFYAWKKRTQCAAVVTTAATTPRDTPASVRRDSSAAIGDITLPPFFQLPLVSPPEPKSPPWVELTLPDGTVIRVPAQQLAAVELVLKMCHRLSSAGAIREGADYV